MKNQDRNLLWLRVREEGVFLLLVAPAIVLIAMFLLFPLWKMLMLSFSSGLEQYARAFSTDLYRQLLETTFWISFLTTVGCVVLGYPVAYVLANASARIRAVLLPLVLVPFWTSILVRTFAWRIILGRSGPINETLQWLGLIDSPLALIFNRTGTLIGMIHILLPLVVLPTFAVLRGISQDYIRAAAVLGASPFATWRRVYLPLSLPGVGAGAILVFILSLGFFITPALLGGPSDRMISNMIETQITELNNWEFASALAFILVAATLLLYVIYSRVASFERLYGASK